jgi:TonB family protein
MKKLESLAASAAQTVQAARQKSAPAAEMPAGTLPEIASETPAGLSVDSIMQKVSPIDPAVRVLRWMVIGLAVPLLVLIGFDWGWNRVPSAPRVPHTTHVEQVPDSEPQPQGPQAVAGAASLAAAAQPKAPAPKTNRDGISSRGGLVVSQNGKVIYREVPSSPDGGTASRSGQSSSKTAGTTEAVPRVQEQGGVAAGDSAISRPLGVTGGRLLKSVQPQYPAEALLEKRQGTVILHGMVRQDGTMQDVKVVRGDPLLGEAALEAVRQWKYEPYRRNGQPVDMPIDITIDFNLPK